MEIYLRGADKGTGKTNGWHYPCVKRRQVIKYHGRAKISVIRPSDVYKAIVDPLCPFSRELLGSVGASLILSMQIACAKR